MKSVLNPRLLLLLALFPILEADVRNCLCDIAKPETLEARECSLCKEAEKADTPFLLVRDINPRKPNRWLILPKKHYPGGHPLSAMPAEDREQFWSAAIAQGKKIWGEDWGAAMNGEIARTQCHGHIHVGRMLEDIEYEGGIFIDKISDIPVPPNGTGIWLHPSGMRLHVHTGEQITESVLLR